MPLSCGEGGSGEALFVYCDVTKEDDCASFVAWAYEQMGGLNALVNNAGILKDGLLVKKDKNTGAVVKMGLDQFNAVINVNLVGATLMVREVVAKMVETEARPGVKDHERVRAFVEAVR